MVRFKRLSDGTDGRRTTFLLYKGYVHKSKKSKTFLAFLDISKALYLEEFVVPVPICPLRQYRLQRGEVIISEAKLTPKFCSE
jgi:hypothetical protein